LWGAKGLRVSGGLFRVVGFWLKHSDSATRDQQYSATIAALIGIGPKDELEGMMAAQLIA
jgi:hypothetical protein